MLPKSRPNPARWCLKAAQILLKCCLNTAQCCLNPAQMLPKSCPGFSWLTACQANSLMFFFQNVFNGKINLLSIHKSNAKASKHNFHSWSCSLKMLTFYKWENHFSISRFINQHLKSRQRHNYWNLVESAQLLKCFELRSWTKKNY